MKSISLKDFWPQQVHLNTFLRKLFVLHAKNKCGCKVSVIERFHCIQANTPFWRLFYNSNKDEEYEENKTNFDGIYLGIDLMDSAQIWYLEVPHPEEMCLLKFVCFFFFKEY